MCIRKTIARLYHISFIFLHVFCRIGHYADSFITVCQACQYSNRGWHLCLFYLTVAAPGPVCQVFCHKYIFLCTRNTVGSLYSVKTRIQPFFSCKKRERRKEKRKRNNFTYSNHVSNIHWAYRLYTLMFKRHKICYQIWFTRWNLCGRIPVSSYMLLHTQHDASNFMLH